MSPKLTKTSKQRNTWSGYVLSLFLTAAGLVLLLWTGARAILWVCHFWDAPIDPALLTLEAVAGGLTSVFGFLMLVQVSPSVDAEATSVWLLPDQRVFPDELPSPDPKADADANR